VLHGLAHERADLVGVALGRLEEQLVEVSREQLEVASRKGRNIRGLAS
jgi:sRNA-binding protein